MLDEARRLRMDKALFRISSDPLRRPRSVWGFGKAAILGCCLFLCATIEATAQTSESLQLETKIPLGDVRGRIDHMAVDVKRQRLFVAELGNDSIGIIDLTGRKVLQRISGLSEPQGVAYVSSTDTLYVANGGDGSVRLYRAEDYTPIGRIELGDDADNLRVDAAADRVYVGYGNGALAVIDPAKRSKIATITLKAHPESFQLEPGGDRIFVNVPKAREIAVIDRTSRKQVADWATSGAASNFPMALNTDAKEVITVFRSPPQIGVFAMADGKLAESIPTCEDSDDLFVDPKRHRIYVSCGSGFLDVYETEGNTHKRIAHLVTVSGARTSLYVPELDRLLLAVRANGAEPAAVWVYRAVP
jgi:YVTN family beta-propeller protein